MRLSVRLFDINCLIIIKFCALVAHFNSAFMDSAHINSEQNIALKQAVIIGGTSKVVGKQSVSWLALLADTSVTTWLFNFPVLPNCMAACLQASRSPSLKIIYIELG